MVSQGEMVVREERGDGEGKHTRRRRRRRRKDNNDDLNYKEEG